MALFGRPCFAAGTPLLTPDGDKPIEAFQPGDLVMAKPEDDPTAELEPRRVLNVFQKYAPLLNLIVAGRTIRTTAEHPFWVADRGWVAAHQLVAGDLLIDHNGRTLAVESVVGEQEAAPVYNLEVQEYHTYFVGSPAWGFDVWAHNAEDCIHLNDGPSTGPNKAPRGTQQAGTAWATKTGRAYDRRFTEFWRQFEGQTLGDGWRVEAVNRRVGTGIKPDLVLVNDDLKQVFIHDITSRPNPAHIAKGFERR